MGLTADKFLAGWAADYVEADPRDRKDSIASAEQCIADASPNGISKEQLLEAASGDIAAFLQKALNQKMLNAGKDIAPSASIATA